MEDDQTITSEEVADNEATPIGLRVPAATIADFLGEKKEQTEECAKVETPITEPTEPKSYRDKKREWNRKNYLRQKERLKTLEDNQIKGADIILYNLNGKLREIKIQCESDYKQFIDDLLGTLKDNEMVSDYLIKSVER